MNWRAFIAVPSLLLLTGVAPDETPVHIPLSVRHNARFGTYKAALLVGIGNIAPVPVSFDTGSSGLRIFASAKLDAPGSGVQCTQTPTSVTYGNPARITYTGVVCYAPLRFGSFTTPASIPIAYLTSASCPPANPDCKIPDLRDPRATGGYGVFGAGITGFTSGEGRVPNPILTLPGRLGDVFTIHLTDMGGDLVLGDREPDGSTEFPLSHANAEGQKWTLGRACLFVNAQAIDQCATISFDTGNGVPWIHNLDSPAIPQNDGLVAAGTRIGFAPPGDSNEAVSVTGGTAFYNSIKVLELPRGEPMANASIQVFLNRIVTYDNARGVIAFSASTSPTR
ncbi:MAG TPA: hypothetical protein VGZ02_17830 [Candidatus Baltobacteraceae bacterium]|nr:hypothetical protein [Candidatus Baltobacteraceae bacterium]